MANILVFFLMLDIIYENIITGIITIKSFKQINYALKSNIIIFNYTELILIIYFNY